MAGCFGWDIGGVHLKVARFVAGDPARVETRVLPFEIWRDPAGLAPRLKRLLDGRKGAHAVTMTAELSDVWAARADGVKAILAACAEALPGPIRVLDLAGRLRPLEEAREHPLDVAASNWLATATVAARAVTSGLLVDVGSTTTDIIPLRDGVPCPSGRRDTDRLISGELVYTGCLRTPPASLASRVPLAGGWCRVAPEHFTNMGDVHLILGSIAEADYTVPTPDGRGTTRDEALRRLALLVCAEIGTIGVPAVESIARFLAGRQVDAIVGGIEQVRSLRPEARPLAVTAGAGAFLAGRAARAAGLECIPLPRAVPWLHGDGWDRAAPAAALAVLLAEEIGEARFMT